MATSGILIVCTIIILLVIWLGLAFVKSAILDKQEMETTILGSGIEEKLNALENIHEERFSKLQDRLTRIEDKIDSLERVMENK